MARAETSHKDSRPLIQPMNPGSTSYIHNIFYDAIHHQEPTQGPNEAATFRALEFSSCGVSRQSLRTPLSATGRPKQPPTTVGDLGSRLGFGY